ncbi:chitin deacetylase [Phlyctochytrium bullatum]|nr:chitin deacetylase [Phlyctochytrium bullatum]
MLLLLAVAAASSSSAMAAPAPAPQSTGIASGPDKITHSICGPDPDFPACEDTSARNNPIFGVKPWVDAVNNMVTAAGVTIPALNPTNGSNVWGQGTATWRGLAWGDPKNPSTELCACNDNRWAFTFDDGPKSKTKDFLQLFAQKNDIKVTFFVLGANIVMDPGYKAALKAAYDAGHQIAMHSWSHPRLTQRDTQALISEIVYTALAIYKTIGQVPRYFRQPYGDIDDRVRFVLASMGLRSVLWTYDTNDFTASGEADIVNLNNNLTYTLANSVYMGTPNQPLNWVPDKDGRPTSTTKTYKGFISLHHELTDIEYRMADISMTTILGSTRQKFTSALVHECDYVTRAGPYMNASDPFYNMIVYWATQLPLRDADLTASTFPVTFTAPVAASNRAKPAGLVYPSGNSPSGNSPSSGGSSLPFGISLWGWIGIGIGGFIVFTGIVVRIISTVYRRTGGFVPFFRDPASTAEASAVQRPRKHGPIGRMVDDQQFYPKEGGVGSPQKAAVYPPR